MSALVTDYLRSLTEQDAEFARLEEQQRQILSRIGPFRGADRLDRDEAHNPTAR